MSPFTHVVLAYLVGAGLMLGYALKVWLSARRFNKINDVITDQADARQG